MNKLQKKILIALLVMVILTPTGILLPMVFHANDAWGEWSTETVKGLVGYVPEGLQKYAEIYKAPMPDYSINADNHTVMNQSFFYVLSGILGITVTFGVTILISKLIIKDGN